MILVSACLCGVNCNYSGGNNLNTRVLKLLQQGRAIPVCPEQLGGLSTPRVPMEIYKSNGAGVLDGKSRVVSSEGDDATDEFLKGAYETLKIAKECGVKVAILKANSPSCGYGKIYDGTFSGSKIEGSGIAAELLKRNGIKIYTEENIGNMEFES